MGHHQLDELDYKILKLVASNARIPFLGGRYSSTGTKIDEFGDS